MSSQEDQYSEARSSEVDNPQGTQEEVPEETQEEVSEETQEEVSEEDDQQDDNTQNASMDQGTQELLGDDIIETIDLISKKGLKTGIRAMKHLQKRLRFLS